MADDNVIENLKGSAKEIAGKLSDDDDLEDEGRAQQEKARKREEAVEAEADAVDKREQARALEGEQRARER